MISVVVSGLFFTSAVGHASTWFVEKDGSGDFTVIQDAFDAAAAGDTIRIGPGRFEDYQSTSYPGGVYDIVGNNHLGDLTVIGAGADMTIIGSEDGSQWERPTGFNNDGYLTGGTFYLSGVTLEGNKYGVISEGGSFDIEGCVFQKCTFGIWSMVNGRISNCKFDDMADGGILAISPGHDLIVEDCEFLNCSSKGFYFQSSPRMNVISCTFNNCQTAGYFDHCSGSIEKCTVTEHLGIGFIIRSSGRVDVTENSLDGGWVNISTAGGYNDDININGNTLSGSELESIRIENSLPQIHGNHILRGERYAVRLKSFSLNEEDLFIDMTNNYWGTTDTDSIAAWIYDGNDEYDPVWGIKAFVVFEPFSTVPLPAEKKSLGGFKSMFR
ncbi:MAG: right-handed parallel beta-helix repeat-containing protein [Bacteroidales bacterium]|nr:right-handed parallel beta-helix repeat-containing protein [Candidatus Latescibacterota bacterium]